MDMLSSLEDHLRITDECSERIKSILQKRYAELESMRRDINDRYPFEDLFLKYDEVDDEETLIGWLLEHLEHDAERLKLEKAEKMKNSSFK